MAGGDDAPVDDALRALEAAAAARLARHPSGHLLRGHGTRLSLTLELPVGAGEDDTAAAARALGAAIDRALAERIAESAAFRPGRVACLRCGPEADCDHGVPPGPRLVFHGYSPTGLPRFIDFGQLLVQRRDPRVDRLYSNPPQLVALTFSEDYLADALLPSFRETAGGLRLHGQVAAGWYRVPDPSGRPSLLAACFQAVSVRAGRAPRRFGLNVVGSGPGGETMERLYERLRAIPWLGAVRWGQSALAGLEREARGTREIPAARLAQRIDAIVSGLARRLAQGERAIDRRTLHARDRHEAGERPTRMALADLDQAGEDGVLLDTRRGTLVVLGERGRAHFFNLAGRLVTSVRYPSATLARRRETGQWRPASAEEIERLREAVHGDGTD